MLIVVAFWKMSDNMVQPHVGANNSSNLLQYTKEDIFKMTFESEEDAFRFYNNYAYATGFSVRKDTVHRNKVTRRVENRLFVCSCEGSRKKVYLEMPDRQREHRALTRCNCTARLRIKLDKENMRYFVTTFVEEHNHNLVPMYGIAQLRSHRHVDDGHGDELQAMRGSGMTPSRMMNHFTHESGGNQRLDSYNGMNHDHREEISDGDAKIAFAYLYGKSEGDPTFFFQHTVDADNQLEKLFWTDGRSRDEFAIFGDVLIFDSTYRKNAYGFPLVILAGVNNHRKTCIFGAAIVQNDSRDSYVWVLKTFLSAVNHKRPLSVITDGDKSLEAAIIEVFPDVQHRICRWHLQRDASKNVKVDNFNNIFSHFMSLKCSIDVFEDAWKKMIVHYGLENHKWIAEVYERRHMWSEAYLRGHFFGLVKSTRCCEEMNAFLNRFQGSDKKLIDFVNDYQKGLERIRINIVNQEVKTNYTKPVLTTPLTELEDHASKVYTREVFKKIKKQIESQATLWNEPAVSDGVGSHTYVVADYNNKGLFLRVSFQSEGMRLICDCKRFESSGMLCKHMIYVLKCEGLNEIPSSCISKRWTADISKEFCHQDLLSATADDAEIARHGYIISRCSEMAFYARKTAQGYTEAIDGLTKLTARAKELWMMKVNSSGNEAEASQPIELDAFDPKKANRKMTRKKYSQKSSKDGETNGQSWVRNSQRLE